MTTFKRNFNFISKEDLMINIAKNIRKYRLEKNLTQEQLALDIGITHDYLRHFENTDGRYGLTLESVYRASVVLDVPINKLFEK